MTTIMNPQQRREICAEACCDDRTLVRYLAGQPVRSSCAYRIERALRHLKISTPTRPGDEGGETPSVPPTSA